MLFSRRPINCYFDSAQIQEFYNLIANDFSDIELIWKSGRKEVDDRDIADSASIKIIGRNMFNLNSYNHRGTINLSLIEGKEDVVFKALKSTRIVSEAPSFGTAWLCLFIYVALAVVICFLRPDASPFIFACFAIHAVGFGGYSLSVFLKWDKLIANIFSIILIIGMLGLAPSSMLSFPMLLAIGRNALFKDVEAA